MKTLVNNLNYFIMKNTNCFFSRILLFSLVLKTSSN